jgi:hypothetical protein
MGCIPDVIVVRWGRQSERDILPVDVMKKESKAGCIFYKKSYSPRNIRAIKRAKSHSGLSGCQDSGIPHL